MKSEMSPSSGMAGFPFTSCRTDPLILELAAVVSMLSAPSWIECRSKFIYLCLLFAIVICAYSISALVYAAYIRRWFSQTLFSWLRKPTDCIITPLCRPLRKPCIFHQQSSSVSALIISDSLVIHRIAPNPLSTSSESFLNLCNGLCDPISLFIFILRSSQLISFFLYALQWCIGSFCIQSMPQRRNCWLTVLLRSNMHWTNNAPSIWGFMSCYSRAIREQNRRASWALTDS